MPSQSTSPGRAWAETAVAVGLSVLLSILSGRAEAEERAPKPFSVPHLTRILEQAGYQEVEAESGDQIRFKREDRIFYLNRFEDGDLVLYFGITGYDHLDTADVNAWNRQKRMTRAYLDNDNDAVLESDLLFDGGLTTRKVAVWVDVFVDLVDGFESFLNERNTADPAAASTPASNL